MAAELKGQAKLADVLNTAMNYSGNSFYAQGRNAQKGINAIQGGIDGAEDADIQKALGSLKSQKAASAIGGAATAVSGIGDILNTSMNMAQIEDTSTQHNQIDSMATIGTGDYGSYGDILTDYTRLSQVQPDTSYDSIRGGSTMERIGGVGKNIASGAMTGLQVGGPWGALAGAVVGLGAGIGGWITGNQNAKAESALLKAEYNNNQQIAQNNILKSTDKMADTQFSNMYRNRMAEGGRLKKQADLRTFADAIMNKRKVSDVTHSVGIEKKYVDGGLMIRIKR